MYKKQSWKPEPEHRMRTLYNRQDRGDHASRKAVKNAKNTQALLKPETKTYFDYQNYNVEAGHYPSFTAEHYASPKPTEKITQQKKYIQDQKSYNLRNIGIIQKNPHGSVRLSENKEKKIYDKMVKVVEPLDIVKRRRLYRMYTFRKPSENNTNMEEKKSDFTEKEPQIKLCQPTEIDRVHSDGSASGKQTMIPKHRFTSPVRYKGKPIIKTITAHEGGTARTYKSVSFLEQKSKAPLKIHMPARTSREPRSTRIKHQTRTGTSKSKTSSSHSQMSKLSSRSRSNTTDATPKVIQKTSLDYVRKLIMNRGCKCKRRSKHSSPAKAVTPPLTPETAKLVPQSVNDHTKHYYEAWVDTTLAAVSSDSEKMRKEKELIVKQMELKRRYQVAMESSKQNCTEERYTGKIVIRR